jgi:leader peptidase (prepilin peptidase)/N-methyltransferase
MMQHVLNIPPALAETLVFALGLVVGSFVGVCAFRLPRGETVLFDVSRCDHCGRSIRWRHKLPIVGFIILRGSSHCCRRPIPRRYPIMEAATGLLFLLLYHQNPAREKFFPAIILVGLLLVGMMTDLEHRLIPDKITLPGMGLGFLWPHGHVPFAGFVPADWWAVLLGIALCGGLLYVAGFLAELVMKKTAAMGGGDIKFAAMIGAFLGWQQGLGVILLAAGVGAVSGYLQLLARRDFSSRHEIRFGPFLALGALAHLFWGETIVTWYFP